MTNEKKRNYAVPSAGYSLTLTVKITNRVGLMAELLAIVAEAGCSIAEIDLVRSDFHTTVRKLTYNAPDTATAHEAADKIRESGIVEVLKVEDDTLELHRGGKLDILPKAPIKNSDQLSRAYTPGVARVCQLIADDPELAFEYTIRKDCVAVITDGSAVLGLGNIGPEASLPVMEGKSALFREFAGLNSFPICLDTQDQDEIIQICKMLAPTFAGINLEDISAPRCFAIEETLDRELNIPVFHDDQHGTAVVVLAGMLNAAKVLNKDLKELKIVVNGFGASGIACIKILLEAGVKNIIACDRTGVAYRGRLEGMNPVKEQIVEITNPENIQGKLADALVSADVFLGLSSPGALTRAMVETMNSDPMIFAMANPVPEIFPDEIRDIAGVIATGRSDYPNQVNNVLCFPGIMRGAINCRARSITMNMKLAAAEAIAATIKPEELSRDMIIPSAFNQSVAASVAQAVELSARADGIAQV